MAGELAHAAKEGRDAGLWDAAEFVAEAAERGIGVGDPAQDPDPAVNLREQIYIEWDDPDGETVQVIVRGPHAAKQEKDRRLSHPRGGGPQYLENALDEILPRFRPILATQVRAHMSAQAKRSRKDRR